MRALTGLFDDYEDARKAIDELEAAGVASDDISIVSNNVSGDRTYAAKAAGTGAAAGAVVGGAGGLLTGLGLMAIPGVGPVVAAGWLAATAAGAAAGAVAGGAAGGIIGALTSSGVSEEDANFYAEGLRRGGTLVIARVRDDFALEADATLKRSNYVDPYKRRRAYAEAGWTRFDPTLDPYSPADIDRERDRWQQPLP